MEYYLDTFGRPRLHIRDAQALPRLGEIIRINGYEESMHVESIIHTLEVNETPTNESIKTKSLDAKATIPIVTAKPAKDMCENF